MRAAISYNGRYYGNAESSAEYKVEITRAEKARYVFVRFSLANPARGHGIGPGAGEVTAVTLSIPLDVAVALGQGVLMAGSVRGVGPILIDVIEGQVVAKGSEAA